MSEMTVSSTEVEMTGGDATAPGAAAPTGFNKYDPAEYDVKTDPNQGYKATEIKLMSFKRPHMRSFHYSWFSFFLAFFAWFAFAPLMSVIGPQLGLTDQEKWTANICSVASTVLMRFIVGPLCDKVGAKNLQAGLMVYGGVMILIAAVAVRDATSLIIMRFLIGVVGATFVPCQFWNSQLFVKEVAGAAQAIAGGWGNLGGGVTQVVMPLVYTACLTGMSEYNAWRYSFIVPGSAALICGVCMLRFSDDTPKGNISELVKANAIQKKSATSSAREGFGEVVTWVLALQYGCCFGVELTVNNMMAGYFTTRFELDLVAAGTIASLFGLMNIFARAIGGFLSDKMNKKFGFRGRLGVQFGCLMYEGIMLYIFSRMETIETAIPMLIMFSVGVQASEGSTFGVVPYVKPAATGSVSGVVGAGGNIGAVCWGFIFLFRGSMPPQDCLMIISFVVIFSALVTPFVFIKEQPGLFFSPHLTPEQRASIDKAQKATKVPTTDQEAPAEIKVNA
mmetsp:Transcript_14958/g.34545  ORF Transcript_14958/g.34545 Transcript_14958/m.34545 type:complete len:506 (-) Transcript_14958:316-1833(-)|eukprot:CAMPEP_0182582488 /NCGR_PEP_ID=MMETSP1324-20130603/52732_1 /TAXON_ID=236786 /ORGANISM="Florenciella sp., Strain RCC1587" /LENGTH=505 /DNA_ID=CAMNT_0024798959 /DNA_START=52 /DNA_END=1569 /DNA_ORIENTATION=+